MVLEYTQQVVNVSGFSPEQEELSNIPIVTAATALDDPKRGITLILILGQAVYLGDKVNTTLLCPNQLCYHGLIVDDVPMHLLHQTPPSTHSIYSPVEDVTIPLSLKGCISYFETRTPTPDEIHTCKWVSFTDEFFWDPHSEQFQENENKLLQHETLNAPPPNQAIFKTHCSHNIAHHSLHSNVLSEIHLH